MCFPLETHEHHRSSSAFMSGCHSDEGSDEEGTETRRSIETARADYDSEVFLPEGNVHVV